jgi:hypothetical protein
VVGDLESQRGPEVLLFQERKVHGSNDDALVGDTDDRSFGTELRSLPELSYRLGYRTRVADLAVAHCAWGQSNLTEAHEAEGSPTPDGDLSRADRAGSDI